MLVRIRFIAVAAAFALAGAFVPPAAAQTVVTHKYDPYFDHMVDLSRAFGLEMLTIRLTVAEAFPAPIPKDLVPQLNRMATKDMGRFLGTLQQKDARLASELKASIDAVVATLNAGTSPAAAAARAKPIVAEAYKVVVDPALQANLQFKTANLANILVAEDGVAEAFEEAGKPTGPWQFPIGWAAYGRAKALWADVNKAATPDQRADGDLMIEVIAPFYASIVPRSPFPAEDAEEVEAHVHHLVTVLEGVVDAHLYVGRDMPRLTQYLADLLAPACTDYAAGQNALATERVYAVLDQFVSEASGLSGVVSVLAPDLEQKAQRAFPRLVITRYQTTGVDMATPAANACRDLHAVLTETKGLVAG